MIDRSKIDLLVVDDDDVDRMQVHRLLGDRFRIHEASCGADARSVLQAYTIDVVLLDYRLPDADGIDLLREIADDIPVVMLTGEDSREIVVESMKGGAQDYLVKSDLSATGLVHALMNAIEKMALRRALAEQQRALTEQARSLARRTRQVRALTSSLTLAEQQERHRISQVLHDNLQQQLYGLKLRLKLLRSADPALAESPAASEQFGQMNAILDDAIRTTRTLSVELSPPVLRSDRLEMALAWLAQNIHEAHGLEVVLDTDGTTTVPQQDLRVLLLQLVRELLFNVVKHAGVDRAELRLKEEADAFVICVRDDGKGFDPAVSMSRAKAQAQTLQSGGIGLFSVRERLELFGGRLDIDSAPGAGTTITIYAPITPDD